MLLSGFWLLVFWRLPKKNHLILVVVRKKGSVHYQARQKENEKRFS